MPSKLDSKLPPQDIEAEQAVLGALMIDKEAIGAIADLLDPEDFYKKAHNSIYRAARSLWERQEPVDIMSLTSELKKGDALTVIGGVSYLTDLVSVVPTAMHVAHYAKIVKEKKVLRDLIHVSQSITEEALGTPDDLETLLDTIEHRIFSISNTPLTRNFTSLKDELKLAYSRIEKMHAGESKLSGVPTGFSELDTMLSGLHKSDLVIVGARPSFGKTSFALDIGRHIATHTEHGVAIFSLEMSREQVVDRLIAAEARVSLWKLRTGRITDPLDYQMIQAALDRLSRSPLYIDDTPSPNILEMRRMARRLQAEKREVGLIVVDYLQLIRPRKDYDSSVQQVTEISRGLKALARELQVPVLAISQLSRAVDQREVKIPRLSDLRESGCGAGDTEIMRADTGEIVTIRSLAERADQTPVPVYTLDASWKLTIRPLVKAFASGVKATYTLALRSGRMIKASANHPFRKLDRWHRLDELTAGDRIAVPRRMAPIEPSDPLSDDELILLAHLIGNGCVLPRQPVHYTSADSKNIQAVAEAASRLFSIRPRVVGQEGRWHVYLPAPYRLTHGKRNPITAWFAGLGFNLVRSYDKRLPAALFLQSNRGVALFLKHLFATDGNISMIQSAGRAPSVAMYYSSTSPALIRQVQHLVARFGVFSTISSRRTGFHRVCYQLWIHGSRNQIAFLAQIGCFGGRGEKIPELVEALARVSPNTNFDVAPQEAWRCAIEPAKAAVGIGWRDAARGLGTSYSGSNIFRNGIGCERPSGLESLGSVREIACLAHPDVCWDEIVSIAPAGDELVYDATVEDTHNFVANDVIIHNSIEQDADVVIFINPPTAAAEEGATEIIIAKHRNGPLGSVRLRFDKDLASFQNLDKIHESPGAY
ncbi:MAG: replicative DNA helicase [Candidatus Colwellbacteria bacterium]|nr:replicative DNA helicase [Candidatus Colwellbacteria bacterium]